MYNIIVIIRLVNTDNVFTILLLQCFPLLLDLLVLRTSLQELNNYSYDCYLEHNLQSFRIGYYCFSTYSAEKSHVWGLILSISLSFFIVVSYYKFYRHGAVKMSWFATRYFVSPCKAALLYKDVNISLLSIRIVIFSTFYTIWHFKLSKNEIYTHLHTVKNCGSSSAACIQEPDNYRPLDAQKYPLPSSTAHRGSEQNEELDFKMRFFHSKAQGRVKNARLLKPC